MASLVLFQDESTRRVILHTEAMATETFRTFARVWSLLYDNTYKRYSEYPFKLRDLLAEGAELDENILCFLTARPCALDSFSAGLREDFGTMESLKSFELRQMLHVFFAQMDTNTHSTERLHSQTTRRTRARSQLTHHLPLHQISLSQCGLAAPTYTRDLIFDSVGRSVKKRCRDPDMSTAPPRKRRKPGGGAFRAFIHIVGQNVVGRRPSFASLAQEYSLLTEDQKLFYQQLGGAATQAHKSGRPSFPRTFRRSRVAAGLQESRSQPGP